VIQPPRPRTPQLDLFPSLRRLLLPIATLALLLASAPPALAVDAGSRFDATIGIDQPSQDYFLRDTFKLNTTAGSSKQSIDKSAGAKCSAFQEFGTWSLTF